MGEGESFSEDISALWGDIDQDEFKPPWPRGTVANGNEPPAAPTTASQAGVDPDDLHRNAARPANAFTGHQVDLVRRAEVGAMRAEMEDAFTQKLAVAIYELLSASNGRFSSVEAHMDRRLQDMAADLNHCIESQSDRLAAAIETQQRMTADLVAAHNEDADRRAEDSAEAGAALSERLTNSEVRDAAATESLEEISVRMESVQGDLNDVQAAIEALREEVSNLRQRPGTWRRWGRSG